MRLGPPCDGVFRAMLELEGAQPHLCDMFLKRVFDAAQRIRLHAELETTVHWQCEMYIGDSLVRIVRTSEGPPTGPLLGHLIVGDSDAMLARAVEAGASAVLPGNDLFPDKHLIDPFGNVWVVMAWTDGMAPRTRKARGQP